MSAGLVTVVIPTHDRSGLVGRAVRSAMAQTYADLEVVVVDDGSSDDTPAVLERLAATSPSVRYVRNDTPSGAAAARNMGVRNSRGQYVAFMDDDCVWDPNKIRLQVAAARETGAGVVYCVQSDRASDGSCTYAGRPASGDTLSFLCTDIAVGTPGVLIEAELFRAVGGFDTELRRLEDWDLWLRCARRTSFAFVPLVLVEAAAVSGSLSTRTDLLESAAIRLIENQMALGGLTRNQQGALRYGVAKFLLAEGCTRLAGRLVRKGLRVSPFKPTLWLALALSFAGPQGVVALRAVRRALAARRWAVRSTLGTA